MKLLRRRKPERGEWVCLLDHTRVRALEPIGREFYKVLMPSGKIQAVHRNELDMPIIDPKFHRNNT